MHRRQAVRPEGGRVHERVRAGSRHGRVLAAAWLGALAVVAGCSEAPIRIDPLSIDGRDGGGPPITYDSLMRIGAAARAGGDLPNAVSIFRRAAALDTHVAAPLVAAGATLLEMGQVNEAILAFNGARQRQPRDQEALRGLAKAYLHTGRPELAGPPLAAAYQDAPDDPKLLLLIGVADDFVGQHREAQERYRRGLELQPGDRALSLNLALSLALTENFAEAIAILRPVATLPTAAPRERQTLALIYGLAGDRRRAEQLGRADLEPAAVQHNLAYYDSLRRLPPERRASAILAASAGKNSPAPAPVPTTGR